MSLMSRIRSWELSKMHIFQWCSENSFVAALGAIVGCILTRRAVIYVYRKWKKYPPGPIGFPIIGSVLSLALYSDKFFINLATKYPTISMYELGTTTMVCINDIKLAKSVLSKKWAHNRAEHLLTKSYPIAFSDISGEQWSKRRAHFRQHITINDKFDDIKYILHKVMDNIDKNKLWYPRKTFVQFMFSLFFKIIYGIDGFNDSINEKTKKRLLQKIVPTYISRAAVVILLGMIWTPLGIFVRETLRYDINMRILMVEMVKEWQNKYKTNTLFVEDVFTTFMAGTDTTGVTLDSCIIHLCKYPEIQRLIYNCITENNNNNDILTAFIYELLRIMPAVPMGLPREIREDNIWIGEYYIPKGCMLHQNVVGMNYNNKLFENASQFNIFRWLKKDENKQWIFNNEMLSDLASFSFGKRDCVGVALAKKILNIVLNELILKYEFTFDNGIDPKNVNIKFGMDLTYHIHPEIGVRIIERN